MHTEHESAQRRSLTNEADRSEDAARKFGHRAGLLHKLLGKYQPETSKKCAIYSSTYPSLAEVDAGQEARDLLFTHVRGGGSEALKVGEF